MNQNLLPACPNHASQGQQARRHHTGRTKPRFSLVAALVMAAMSLVAMRAQAQAPVNLVLDTGNNTAVPSRITGNGAPILRVGPSNPTVTFNGVTIRYLGTESVTPLVSDPFAGGQTAAGTVGRFIVLGDLDLAANQRIFGLGPNLVRLEVGNNATIAAGATIDVSAQGGLSGAGGGAGGATTPSPMVGATPRYTNNRPVGPIGGFFGFGGTTASPDGAVGQTAPQVNLVQFGTVYRPGTQAYASLFRSVAGGQGQAGQGNVAVAAGGVERIFRGSIVPPDPRPDPGVADLVLATPGSGGTSGIRGGAGVFGESIGGNGGTGGNGGNGIQGLNAASAAAILSLTNPSVVSLRGGNGGGAGAAGGAGLPGASGGGGGGGGASAVSLNGNRGTGGRGGDGGAAGMGGAAGLGGAGGGGGGGIQLLVRGSLNIASGASVRAVGGDAGAGQAGGTGSLGNVGEPGTTVGFSSGAGNGGTGGKGGNGGTGGAGGNGMGGSGGVVQIVASTLSYSGATLTTGGLGGDGVTRSASGATAFHAYSGASAGLSTDTYFGARAAGDNPYRSFATSISFGAAPAGLAPNLPSIVGGAAPYGLLTGESAAPGVTPLTVAEGVKFVTDILAPPTPGAKRVGAVTRVSAEWLASSFGISALNNDNHQVLLFSAFNGDVARPALMAVDPSHTALFGDHVPTAPMPLRQGNGYLNDPSITAGAVAPTDMTTLSAGSTFAMYASGTQNITAAFSPYTAPRYFTGTPMPAGNFGLPGASTVFLEDKGLLRLGVVARSNDANRNAASTSQRETTGNFATTATANLRAGGDNIVSASAQGVGNVDTVTSGTAAIRTMQRPGGTVTEPGPLYTQATVRYDQVGVRQFWGTATFALSTDGLPIGTTQRVAEIVFTPEYDNTTRNITAPVDARIFGPTPRLQGAGTSGNTFTFAAIQAGTAVISRFSLQNADVLSSLGALWSNAINADPELIRLTILGFELTDPSGVFSLSSLGNLPLPFALEGNQTAPVDIRFSPTAVGSYSATLRLLTDMNAPVGQRGDYYVVSLFATAVDEPPSLLLLLGGGVVLLLRRYRRGSRSAH